MAHLRDVIRIATRNTPILGGWLSLFPKSFPVLCIVFPCGIVRPLNGFHNSLRDGFEEPLPS